MNSRERAIVHYYRRGVASYLIAKRYGVSNNYVRGVLTRAGIPIRGHSITNKVSAAKRTPEENKAITRAAANANAGGLHTISHRVNLAKSREKNPTIDEKYELPLLNRLKALKIPCIPQKAFYKHNVDLYLPSKNLVIEIFGGNFHNKKDAVGLFQSKMNYLAKRNVPVLIVWADQLTFSPEAIIKTALSIEKEPLTIINGDGSASSKGRGDINLE